MNYEEMTKEELVQYIKDLNEEQNGKYGLVWDKEKEPEKIVEECDKYIPVLKEIKEKRIDNKGIENILIEGDNFHSISVLNYTHKESIDVIYIDPPYNTGNQDFIYNDKFIDLEDGYRHSKWLNFMEKRLKLARNLLKETGTIMLSIDDNEFAQLKLLCDKIFGDKNFIGNFIVNAAPNGRDYGAMAKQHEYCLLYSKNIKEVYSRKIKDTEKRFTYKDEIGGFNIHPLYNSNVAFTPANRPNLYYPFYVKPEQKEDGFYEISLEKKDGYVEVYPPMSVKGDAQFVWRWGRIKSEENLNKEIIGHKVNDEFRIVQKMRHSEKLIRSLLTDSIYSTRRGTAELEKILGKKTFSYPKPKDLIKVLIEATCPDGGIVLDFFAGSGTTGQAVLELNNEDSGNRQFILCTNNEGEICTQVTYPRLKNVMNGLNECEKLGGNLKYYETEFVENNNNRDQLYYDLTEKCIPMLSLKEECFIEIKSTDEYKIFKNNEDTKVTAVYYDLFGNKEKDFVDELKSITQEKVIYKFSLGEYIDASIFDGVKDYKIEPIPYRIVELYRRLAKMSKEEN